MHLEVPYQVTVASDDAVAVDAVAIDAVAIDAVAVDTDAAGGTGYNPRDSLTAPGGELRA